MFKINDIVKLKNSNITGKIIRIANNNKGENYTIELNNNTKMKISDGNIELLNVSDKIKKNSIKINYTPTNTAFENEIMIRHQTVIEAIENVDRFISSAIINKEKRIKIIHGRHGGILRNAVHEYLKNSPYVDCFKLANEYEGSIGATIVYLK